MIFFRPGAENFKFVSKSLRNFVPSKENNCPTKKRKNHEKTDDSPRWLVPLLRSGSLRRQRQTKTVGKHPEKAPQLIRQHIDNEKVSLAKSDRDFLEVTYEVIFTSGMKVEFTKDGQWKEVDSRYASVPKGIVPVQITKKVQELYPEATIRQIDRDSRDYEVKLSNGLELTIDLKLTLDDIDD